MLSTEKAMTSTECAESISSESYGFAILVEDGGIVRMDNSTHRSNIYKVIIIEGLSKLAIVDLNFKGFPQLTQEKTVIQNSDFLPVENWYSRVVAFKRTKTSTYEMVVSDAYTASIVSSDEFKVSHVNDSNCNIDLRNGSPMFQFAQNMEQPILVGIKKNNACFIIIEYDVIHSNNNQEISSLFVKKTLLSSDDLIPEDIENPLPTPTASPSSLPESNQDDIPAQSPSPLGPSLSPGGSLTPEPSVSASKNLLTPEPSNGKFPSNSPIGSATALLPDEQSSSFGSGIIVGGAAVAALIATLSIIAFVYLRKRRGGSSQKNSPPQVALADISSDIDEVGGND